MKAVIPTTPRLIILDMDECLLHATATPLVDQTIDFRYQDLNVYFRPHVATFLSKLHEKYAVAIWSTGTDKYVEHLIKAVTPSDVQYEFVWGRSKCRKVKDDFFGYTHYYKPIDKLKRYGYELSDIIMIDDTPSKIIANHSTLITIDAYEGQQDDVALMDILQQLNIK